MFKYGVLPALHRLTQGLLRVWHGVDNRMRENELSNEIEIVVNHERGVCVLAAVGCVIIPVV